jgi:hypothetical protein
MENKKISDRIAYLQEQFNKEISKYEHAVFTKLPPEIKKHIFYRILKLHEEIKEVNKLKSFESENNNRRKRIDEE